ncbi:MAG TPA: 4-hydroxy-tetrahydrodipicolinate synthase [Rhodospirillales bacterium]|jgi:4-hydroxy-tetrahydrodipicolinate synthase|nr:4-hydroxy-tetrahydrodipicolinate synthase [Rhodospirillales bacterium]HIL76049.1 4-hydroxy-tetrahydrodipicolinate synthase [Rhodospirillales bacterium]
MTYDLSKIKGSIPPIITPFKNDQLDYEAYAGLVEFQISKGSHGILVNGTTAEPSTLTADERNKTIDTAIATNNGRLPIIAATGSQSLAESRMLTRYAAEVGVDALLIVTPYYISPPQRGLVQYYLDVMDGIDTPWMIYHIPGRAAVSITLETVKELKDRSSNFIGMKHAVNDLAFVSECIDAFPDYLVFVGLEELSFPEMAIGAVGLMNAVGNLRPDLLAEMCQAVWDNDLSRGKEIHQRLLEINQSVFYDTNPIPIKYMMKRLGIIPENHHRLPMMPAEPELEKRLDGVLERAGLL